MFIRRYYYDKTSGNTVLSYSMDGDIRIQTVQQDYEFYTALSGRNTENTGLFEWLEKDPVIEQNFRDSYGRITVDVSQSPHTLVFDTTPITIVPAEDELETAKEALTELGVDVNA